MNFDSEVTKGDWYSTPVLRPLSAPEGCSLRSCVSPWLGLGTFNLLLLQKYSDSHQ